MRVIEIAAWLGLAAAVILLVALDAKAKMTWLGIAFAVAAVIVAVYAGVDLRELARR
jgi:hypothetical protein